MSIEDVADTIRGFCKERVLFPVEPPPFVHSFVRLLYVTGSIHVKLTGQWESAEEEIAWQEAKAIMEAFVEGRLMSVATGKSDVPMKLLSPEREGVWALRATRPKPGIRLFGQFVYKDVFVATNYETRMVLGKENSLAWKDSIRACKTCFRNLFFPYPPVTGGDLNEYISRIYIR